MCYQFGMKKLLLLLLVIFTPHLGRAGGDDAPVTRIAFGSCAHQDKPQPIWDAVQALKPQLFLMIGDSVYHDVIVDKNARDETLPQKYAKARSVPGFQKLLKQCALLGTWDDHDYGLNDAGAEYAHKKEAQQAFLDYLGVPADSPRRKQEGIYHAQLFGPPQQRLQIILLDTRYFRGPLKKRAKSIPREGPYDPSSDQTSSMLGEPQWQWLADQLKVPAKVRILASSIQVVAQDHHHEKWMNLPHERERLFKVIRDTQAAGLVCLSGDRHLAEVSMMDAGIGYPLYDLTSSGLTQAFKSWRPLETNRHRVATMNWGNNFGVVEIDWQATDPLIRLQIRDEDGAITIQEKVRLSTLQPGKLKGKGGGLARLADGSILTMELVKGLLKKEITLEMDVQATGSSKSGDLVFLNSSSDFSSEDNFTVVLDKKAQESLSKAGIAAPRTHFEGKMIRVTGILSLFRERPQIIVSEAARIQIMTRPK